MLDCDLFLSSGILLIGYNGAFFIDDQECFDRTVTLGNVAVKPELGTLHDLPWAGGDHKVGEILCEARWIPDYSYITACPRYAARQQIQGLKDSFGFEIYSSYEAEFVILENEQPLSKATNFMSSFVLAQNEKMLYDLSSKLIKAGVDVESVGVELDWGQFEITTKPTTGIKAADMMFILREATREITDQNNMSAHFMSVPYFPGDTGGEVMSSGLHYNHSLVDKFGKNPFYDRNSPDNLSSVWRHWMAGLAAHSPALMALYCPTVNCYRRCYYCLFPQGGDWALDDRKVSFRVQNATESATYIECRLPSAAANPYLILAATIAAGMDGLKRKLECPPARDPTAPALPKTLGEAVEVLKSDTVLREALGDELIRLFYVSREKLDLKILHNSDVASPNDREGFMAEWEMYKHA